LRVLDPMAGSGTSLIVGRAAGHSAYGFDADPLAVLISKVATADAKLNRVEERGLQVLRLAKRMDVRGSDAYPCDADEETRRFVRYWFDLEVRKQLSALVRVIQDIDDSSSRKFLWCALSRMIVTKDAGVSLARDVSHSRPHKSFNRAPDACAPTNVFVISTLVGILEASPAADIVDKHGAEIGPAIFHVMNQLFQGITTVDAQAALAGIRIGPRDGHATAFGILPDGSPLILCRILLVLR